MSVVYGIASDISKPGVRAIKETNQALHYYAASLFAGEELTGDRFLSIQRITKDWKGLVITPATVETLVVAEPCRLGKLCAQTGAYVSGTITVRDAAAISGGSTGYIFPSAFEFNLAEGLRMENGYTIQFSVTPAGSVLPLYREAEFTL